MPEPIPFPSFDIIGLSTISLDDESVNLGLMSAINFVGDRQQAGIVILEDGTSRGVVVVKAENDIPGIEPSWFSSDGSFTTPLHTGTSGQLSHTLLDSNNFILTGTSNNRVTAVNSGTYLIEIHVEGDTTSTICNAGNDDTWFYYVVEFKQFSSTHTLKTTLTETGGLLSFENCDLGGSFIADASVVLNFAAGDYVVTTVFIYEQLGFCAAGCTTPSSAGTFSFQMHRVSLGT
jgi:hypothetical protein